MRFTVLLGELLLRQSSGDHPPEAALGVQLSVPRGERVELGGELLGGFRRVSGEGQEWQELLLRPAALATVRLGEGRMVAEAGAGVAVGVVGARWVEPAFPIAWQVQPGARAKVGAGVAVGAVELGLGLGAVFRQGGGDYDLTLGVSW